MNEIFFSVIIPNYNNSTYLEKCLKSVLNQTFTNYELIVIDDVSTDNSVEIIKNIFNQYQNKNTKLIKLKEKLEMAAAAISELKKLKVNISYF